MWHDYRGPRKTGNGFQLAQEFRGERWRQCDVIDCDVIDVTSTSSVVTVTLHHLDDRPAVAALLDSLDACVQSQLVAAMHATNIRLK